MSTLNHNSTFETEIMKNRSALMNHALRLTRHQRDAEDLLQDTLMKAYRNLDKFEEGTNFKAWLFRIMTNEYINQYRHTQRERSSVDRSESVSENIADARDVSYDESLYVENSEDFGDEVSHAIHLVPNDFRTIVVMADIQDQSYREISEKLEIPIGTVMSRLFRGRQILRKKLQDYARSLGIIRA